MQLNPVESSNIAAAGYDPAAQRLEVEFKSGGTYVYKNVPPSEADGFFRSDSKGKYLNVHIKGTYTSEKVAPPPKEEK